MVETSRDLRSGDTPVKMTISQVEDFRMEFLKEYTISSLKLKKEKWKKIIVSDEQREYLTNFIETDFPDVLVISQNAAGHLQIHVDWPSELKYKGIDMLQLTVDAYEPIFSLL